MYKEAQEMLQSCDTLMLDMDGTLLDLAFDNYVWLQLVPAEYAQQREIPEAQAREELYATMRKLQFRGNVKQRPCAYGNDPQKGTPRTLNIDLPNLSTGTIFDLP